MKKPGKRGQCSVLTFISKNWQNNMSASHWKHCSTEPLRIPEDCHWLQIQHQIFAIGIESFQPVGVANIPSPVHACVKDHPLASPPPHTLSHTQFCIHLSCRLALNTLNLSLVSKHASYNLFSKQPAGLTHLFLPCSQTTQRVTVYNHSSARL